MEYFRLDDSGRLNDTQERLTSRGYGVGDGDNPFSALPILVRTARRPARLRLPARLSERPVLRQRGPGPRPARPPAAVPSRPDSRHYRQQPTDRDLP